MVDFSLLKTGAIKAYEQANDPPFPGDIRPTKDYPAGTPFSAITEFEVWDGKQWICPNQIYSVQSHS